MTEPTELLPCPFCGGAASLHNDTDSPCWFVGCSNSTCSIEPCHYADTKAGAIATWNRRTTAQPQAVPLTPKQVAEIADAAHSEYDLLVSSGQCAPRWSTIFAHLLERAHGITGGQYGTE